MEVLPVKLIDEEDQLFFGANLFNLAKLARLNFPIPSGIAVTAPKIQLDTLLEHHQYKAIEIFGQSLTLVKKDLKKIPILEVLQRELKCKQKFYVDGELLSSQQEVWFKLLDTWLNHICFRLFREGFTKEVTHNLPSQVIWFVSGKGSLFKAYLPEEGNSGEVKVEPDTNLSFKLLGKIEEIIKKGNKKLYFPHVYHFLLIHNDLYLINVTPQSYPLLGSTSNQLVIPDKEQKKVIKSAIKVFLNLSQGFTIEKNIDGVFVEKEKCGNGEETIFKLAEAALSFPTLPVIFKLPDINEGDDIRGTLRLLHQESLLKEAVEAFLFARNKKHLYNIHIAIPYIRTSAELMEIKRELSAKGITRGTGLKLWIEMSTPENIINCQDYIQTGIDGVILNVDELWQLLAGFIPSEGQFYQNQVETVTKFIEPLFKTAHKHHLPILVRGEIVLNHQILESLIQAGVWGIVTNNLIEAESLPEHLHWSEERVLRNHLKNPNTA